MTDHVQISPIATGVESDVYQVSIDGLDLILKAKHPDGKQQYEYEAFAYFMVAVGGATVPHVTYVDNEALLMTMLTGQEMDDRPELFHDRLLIDSIATDLAYCHSIKLPGFGVAKKAGDSFIGTYASWQDYLDDTGKILETLQSAGSLSVSDVHVLNKFWRNTASTMTLQEGALVHGDFAMSAVFVEGTTYTGIIDFGDALIGDPLMDLAYFRFKEITKPYGYRIYSLLYDAYSKATGEPEDEGRILFYMVYWGLQRLSHCPDDALRIKFGDKLHIVTDLIRKQYGDLLLNT